MTVAATDRCSRCGEAYGEHAHTEAEAKPAEGRYHTPDGKIAHSFRTQPLPGRSGYEPWDWPDGRWS